MWRVSVCLKFLVARVNDGILVGLFQHFGLEFQW